MWKLILCGLFLCSSLLSSCCGTFCPTKDCSDLVVKPKAPPADAWIRPQLDIETLQPTAQPNEVFEAYYYSVYELIDHVTYLEGLLRGYK